MGRGGGRREGEEGKGRREMGRRGGRREGEEGERKNEGARENNTMACIQLQNLKFKTGFMMFLSQKDSHMYIECLLRQNPLIQ